MKRILLKKFIYLILTLNLYQANQSDTENTKQILIDKLTNKVNPKFNPINYLISYGYLNADFKKSDLKKTLSSLKINSIEINNAIKSFQKFANLNQTGVLDTETLNVMKLPRCGHPDLKPTSLQRNSKNRRYILQGSKWSKSKLNWKIGKYPDSISMANHVFNEEIVRAFGLWSSVSGLEFEQELNSNAKADIEIRFESGFHGDSEPFDGPGLILGHAFFPEFSSSTHFDADEAWTSHRFDGVNFYQVAVHELGHALGLEHSDNYDAIMAPFFRGYTEDFHLHSDDLTAIGMLYGANDRKNKKVLQAERTKSVSHKNVKLKFLCSDQRFDAITLLSDYYTYIFKGAYVYKLDSDRNLAADYPKLISTVFRDWAYTGFVTLPNNLDAVLYLPENKTTYFFKNNLYWKSSALYELDPYYPRLISADFVGLNAKGGFTGKLDAAFVWSGNRQAYFVANNQYWRFDYKPSGWLVGSGYPKDLSYWKGLNSKITNAFLYSDDKTYFFKDNLFYQFNDQLFQVDNEFSPRLNNQFWFYCN